MALPFDPVWAVNGPVRDATVTEQDQGFPCGEADRALFNGLFQDLQQAINAFALRNAGADIPVLGWQKSPPASPAVGDRYVVAAAPTGAWAGQVGKIAMWAGAGWVFADPPAALQVQYWAGRQVVLRYDGTAWAEWLGSETAAGPVQLATLAKVLAGTDTSSAVPPAYLKTLLDQRSSAYAVLAHTELAGVDAGNAPVANAWFTRKTNTKIADPQGIVALNSDQFTLQPGRYLVQAYILAEAVQRHMARIYCVTDAAVVDNGTTANAADAAANDLINSYSIIFTEIVIAAASGPKVYRIEQRCDQVGPSGASYGLGLSNTYGATNRYTLITLQKVV